MACDSVTSRAPRRLENRGYISYCSLSLAMFLRCVRERLRSSDLVGFSITAAVDLLQGWMAPLNGEGATMLLAAQLPLLAWGIQRQGELEIVRPLLSGGRGGGRVGCTESRSRA